MAGEPLTHQPFLSPLADLRQQPAHTPRRRRIVSPAPWVPPEPDRSMVDASSQTVSVSVAPAGDAETPPTSPVAADGAKPSPLPRAPVPKKKTKRDARSDPNYAKLRDKAIARALRARETGNETVTAIANELGFSPAHLMNLVSLHRKKLRETRGRGAQVDPDVAQGVGKPAPVSTSQHALAASFLTDLDAYIDERVRIAFARLLKEGTG